MKWTDSSPSGSGHPGYGMLVDLPSTENRGEQHGAHPSPVDPWWAQLRQSLARAFRPAHLRRIPPRR